MECNFLLKKCSYGGHTILTGTINTIASNKCINNLREKFSPEPGIEPGSPALRAGAITTKPPRRSAGPIINI